MSFTCPLFKVETALVLIPHGESMWNEKILFTGSVDVPLTRKGVEEAIEAGKRICNIPLDFVYTSALIRSQMTPVLALTQHRCKKNFILVAQDGSKIQEEAYEVFFPSVPIIMHNCSTQAEAWSQIYSDEAKRQSFPEIAERYGKEQVHEWRRGVMIFLHRRVRACRCAIKEHAAHANSLRCIIMYLEKLTSRGLINLELSTGVALLYIYKEGSFMKRGSPVGHSEAGVYALTRAKIFYLI
ncbi:unnamed protein product [Citrullus colocynthis]|uniref:phosphoglycerate mutase (2,3-diphosphoglycerate-dependent) n=1 Tax=Citrullus colocynthis TaxID=252529 RepID=A0ABP0YM58_9ROSI